MITETMHGTNNIKVLSTKEPSIFINTHTHTHIMLQLSSSQST